MDRFFIADCMRKGEIPMSTPQLQAIWEKILRGEPLAQDEQTAWSNRFCMDYPRKP